MRAALASTDTADGPQNTARVADRLLTPEQVAERWSVGKSQVWRLAREGHLPSVHVGRYVRFRLADLETWEQEGGCGV
jgi:excisionase family DNA binding protein